MRAHETVIHDDTVYPAGMIASGPLLPMKDQMAEVLKQMVYRLERAGRSTEKLVTDNVSCADMHRVDELNEAWDAWLDVDNAPTRACVERGMSRGGWEVELTAVAALDWPEGISKARATLLIPFEIGGRTLCNRVVSTAHGEQRAAGRLLTDYHLDYCAPWAEGGAGLLITFGPAPVSPAASTVSARDPRDEPRPGELAVRVHAQGAIIPAQTSHRGPRDRPDEIDAALPASSTATGADRPTCEGVPHVLTEEDVAGIVPDFAVAAARPERCNLDGIEVTGLGIHLIERFRSPVLDRREDHYGGSVPNRTRLAIEVLAAVDDATPPEFLIAFRMSVDPQSDLLGLTGEDLLKIGMGIEETGLFDLSGGSGANGATHGGVVRTDTFPVMPCADLTRHWKRRIGTPILMAGRVLHPDDGEAAPTSGARDLVATPRAMIADPDVVSKTAAGHGARIRPCIALDEG